MTKKQYVVNDIVKFNYSEIWRKSDDEMHTDTPLRNDEVVELLNEQEETINELKIRNKRQYERLNNIGDLMFKRDWETLGLIVDKWEKEEERLRKYGG